MIKKSTKIICFCLVIGVFSSARAEIRDLPTVNILVTPAFAELMTGLGRHYAREREITFNLVILPSAEQYDYLQRGETADLLFTTDREMLTRLRYQGMLDIYHTRALARQPLLLVGAHPLKGELRELLKQRPLYIGRLGSSPAGDRALALMRRLKLPIEWLGFDAAGPARQRPMLTFPTGRHAVQQALKDDAAAIAWAADAYALQSDEEPLHIWGELPLELPDLPEVQAAVVAGENMKPARDLFAYLQSDKSRTLFRRYGLHPLEPAPERR